MTSNQKLYENMGRRIYERRKQLGLTQEQLAEQIDVTPQMISTAELGKKAMRSENILKLSNVLNISCDYILKGYISNADIDLILEKARDINIEEYEKIYDVLNLIMNAKNR
ncbi:MAG: helix-turn-helix domain-containing protein [Eubacterium sp.]